MKKETAIVVIRSLLILLFLYAAFSKIFDPAAFKNSMYKQPFPHWMSTILMFVVPAAEIYTSFILLSEKKYKQGLKASAILMGLFTLYIAVVLLHAFKYVPCSCGGVISSLTWTQHLIFNIFFLVIAVLGLFWNRNRNSYNNVQKGSLSL